MDFLRLGIKVAAREWSDRGKCSIVAGAFHASSRGWIGLVAITCHAPLHRSLKRRVNRNENLDNSIKCNKLWRVKLVTLEQLMTDQIFAI